jgi:hypothetical protein
MQIKILEEENIDLRDIMNQMRKRAQDGRRLILFIISHFESFFFLFQR